MKPYGRRLPVRHKCVGHGETCTVCCPVTKFRGSLDDEVREPNKGRERRNARSDVAELMDYADGMIGKEGGKE